MNDALAKLLSSARPLDGGWTSETFESGGSIGQVARTPYAAATLRHQLAVLPRLAPHLPVAVPAVELVCDEPVAIRYPKLQGAPCGAALPGPWPEQLGETLHRLHAVAPDAIGLPRLDAAAVRDDARATCARLRAAVAPHLDAGELARAEAMIAAYLDDDRLWTFAPVVSHRDLGPEHVLVDADGALVGVIDWEEVGVADPSGDFTWWLYAMPRVAERMLAAYGELDTARCRFLYALMPWYEVEYGVTTGSHEHVASGLAGVRARMV